MFEIKNISKQYNNTYALKNVSFNIAKGMNFIVGASGSGKTTLLKIMSGFEQEFEGEITYCKQNIKELSEKEKSYFYNNVFGFIWQDFNLIEDNTVLENIVLPCFLKENVSQKNIDKTLKDLKIFDLATKKVKYLSGGQKQRVAIARELMKNPQVILADEPTSGLDENSSKTIMNILRELSKTKTVIVVTHDTSSILEKDIIFELDKGELISSCDINVNKSFKIKPQNKSIFSLSDAFILAKINIKNKIARFIISIFTLMIACVLLLVTLNGSIRESSQDDLNKLFDSYGDSLTDITLFSSFSDAASSGGEQSDKPSGDVSQDIKKIYRLYEKDKRIKFITYIQPFDQIKITLDGKQYDITSSGSVPVINKLVAGKMPMGNGFEVVIPESFAKSQGKTAKDMIGKEIDFNGSIFNWSSGEPVAKPTSSKLKIVGVMDTTMNDSQEGKMFSYSIDDSFLFSKNALDKMLKQAEMDTNKLGFLIRAKTPATMIEIKDELNEKGIVPIGHFELVEDMVRINEQTSQQSGSASISIAILSMVMVVAVFFISAFTRKREYAIYKISGYHKQSISLLNLVEAFILMICTSVLILLTSPILNSISKQIFNVTILNDKIVITTLLLVTFISMITYLINSVISLKTNPSTTLKSGN